MPNPNSQGWSNRPPGDVRPFYPICRPFMSEVLRGVVLSEMLIGRYTHFHKALCQTIPCTRETDHCEGCRLKLARRWRGYLWVATAGKHPVSIFEVPKLAALDHQDRLAGAAPGIAGYGITLRRRGGLPQGRVILTFDDLPRRLAGAYALPSLIDTLTAIWTEAPDPPELPPAPDDDAELIPYPGVG